MPTDRKKFFDGYRHAWGRMEQSQVEALEFLLSKFDADPMWKRVHHVAYALATIKHETANTFKPIKEYRAKAGSKGRKNQDRYWNTGYYGRGYVQLTWKRNYELFEIENNPDKALEPETAFLILTTGMFSGLFTGKAFKHYIHAQTVDYVGARAIINGKDQAELIAGYAKVFEKILKDSAVVVESSAPLLPSPSEENPSAMGVQPVSPLPQPSTPKGDPPSAPATVVTKNSVEARRAAVTGAVVSGLTVIGGWVSNNLSAAGIIAICVTVLCLAIIFRGTITDLLRMWSASDPDKHNVS